MSSKPILFNTEMVKAILDGRKTQTRRVIPLKNNDLIFTGFVVSSTAKNREGYCAFGKNKEQDLEFIKPKYKVGDVLYVREPTRIIEYTPVGNYGGIWNDCDSARYEYLSDGEIGTLLEIPERFNVIPKWIKNCQGVPNGCLKEMARIFLKVTNVRVERLQDISDDDCIKEGISEVGFYPDEGYPLCTGYMAGKDDGKTALANTPQKPFSELWNSTAKDGYKWEDNPYVFVYEFEGIEKQ